MHRENQEVSAKSTTSTSQGTTGRFQINDFADDSMESGRNAAAALQLYSLEDNPCSVICISLQAEGAGLKVELDTGSSVSVIS